MGGGCIDQNFLDLSTSWRSVVSFTPRSLYPRYTLDRKLGEPQSRSGRRGEEKILDPPVVQAVDSRYTDYAIPSREHIEEECKYL
jgi:hypothetical protein